MLQTEILWLFVMSSALSLTFPFSGSLGKLPQQPKLKRKRIKEAPETPETCPQEYPAGAEGQLALDPRALVPEGMGDQWGERRNCLCQKDAQVLIMYEWGKEINILNTVWLG